MGGITIVFHLWTSFCDEVILEAAVPVLSFLVGNEEWVAVLTSWGWKSDRNTFIEGLIILEPPSLGFFEKLYGITNPFLDPNKPLMHHYLSFLQLAAEKHPNRPRHETRAISPSKAWCQALKTAAKLNLFALIWVEALSKKPYERKKVKFCIKYQESEETDINSERKSNLELDCEGKNDVGFYCEDWNIHTLLRERG